MLFFHFRLGRGFVGVCAKWKTSNNICFLVNVYSPCDFDGKKELWIGRICYYARGVLVEVYGA